jgi:hypothetical protein
MPSATSSIHSQVALGQLDERKRLPGGPRALVDLVQSCPIVVEVMGFRVQVSGSRVQGSGSILFLLQLTFWTLLVLLLLAPSQHLWGIDQ